mmetsp:Transcript_20536/g.30595  ORF Transcript_20536/g.30595 Transcript_20536/m.30595 type:complete len:155 (-) Transcript_20536:139-603(-)
MQNAVDINNAPRDEESSGWYMIHEQHMISKTTDDIQVIAGGERESQENAVLAPRRHSTLVQADAPASRSSCETRWAPTDSASPRGLVPSGVGASRSGEGKASASMSLTTSDRFASIARVKADCPRSMSLTFTSAPPRRSSPTAAKSPLEGADLK